jgi:flagellin
MSMVIGTNIGSLSAQRHLAASKGDMDSAMERLSSGSRINSSRDDAAGLAISGRMTSQINGLNQAVRNANDGISLAQSAEGALDETTTILQRMRELSVQASSSTLTTSDRSSIQAEVTELTTELDRISDVTTFNNIHLLNGTADNLQFQVGATAGESVSLTITGSSASALGLSDGSSSGSVAAVNGTNMTSLSALFDDSIELNGKDWTQTSGTGAVGTAVAVTNADGVAVNAKTTTADGVAAIINDGTDRHGVVATASNSVMSGVVTVTDSATISGLTIGGSTIDDSNNLTELVANINAQATGAQARIIDSTHYELYNTTGEDIVVGATITNSGLSASSVNIGSLSLSNTDGSATLITRGDHATASTANINSLGFNERGAEATIESKGISGTKLILADDDLTLNGVAITPSTNPAAAATAATLAAHINTFTGETDVKASASTKVTLDMNTTNPGGAWTVTTLGANDSLVINGISMDITDAGPLADQKVSTIVTALNTALAAAGITATQDEGKIVLEHSLGNTITIDESQGVSSNIAMIIASDGSTTDATVGNTSADSFTGNLTLTNEKGGAIKFDTEHGNATELQLTLNKLGLQAQGSTDQVETAGAGLSMDTVASANLAITALDAALEKVFASRGDLGAFQNRLDHTVSNLRNVSENMSAAKSQIMDTDFAIESANLAKAQVLQQAGTAMLAQANASGQGVLSLLK